MSTESSKRTVAAANFNDDLTCYIESEKAQLTQMLTTQETVTREIVSNIKNRYEHELSNARKLYDEMARKCAKLEIDVEDFKSKLEKKTKDLEIAERNGMIYETRCNDLQLLFDQSQAEKKEAMKIIEIKDKNLELASSSLDWTRAQVMKHRCNASRHIPSEYNLQHHAQFETQNLRDDLQKYCREQLAVLARKLNEEIQKQSEKLIFQEIKVSE
ncbi:lamin-C-like [Formica exsecta]|uniref:lamin-C-like n=1 Tax=Formica exsecta TaxID=72781 RepID=UPI001141C437|nr:lamin-C-like [Formica exsecta]